jgi:hypothetical protein
MGSLKRRLESQELSDSDDSEDSSLDPVSASIIRPQANVSLKIGVEKKSAVIEKSLSAWWKRQQQRG